MSRRRSPYGTISRGEARRRKKRRDDTIRVILGLVLGCVLILGLGFLGVKAMRKTSGKGGTTPGGTQSQTEAGGESQENQTPEQTDAQTEPPETEPETDPPVMANQSHTVWLDAGHGGTDYGTSSWVFDEEGYILDKDGNRVLNAERDYNTNAVTREKDDTLLLTLAIQRELEARGVTVLMTRTDDVTIDRFTRCDMVNASDAECFVSIHRNFMEISGTYFRADTSACGILACLVNEQTRAEVPGKEKDIDLYQFIMDQLAEEDTNGLLGYFREASKKVDLSVLFRTNIPAILLEMGYQSNASDNEKYFANIDAYAAAIADGIVEWLNTQD